MYWQTDHGQGKLYFSLFSSESTEGSFNFLLNNHQKQAQACFWLLLVPFLSRSFSWMAFENYLFEACPDNIVDANYALSALSCNTVHLLIYSKWLIHCAFNAWKLQQGSVKCWEYYILLYSEVPFFIWGTIWASHYIWVWELPQNHVASISNRKVAVEFKTNKQTSKESPIQAPPFVYIRDLWKIKYTTDKDHSSQYWPIPTRQSAIVKSAYTEILGC